jgi:hypothetical protein
MAVTASMTPVMAVRPSRVEIGCCDYHGGVGLEQQQIAVWAQYKIDAGIIGGRSCGHASPADSGLLPPLIEGDADPLFLPPDDATGQVIAVRHQRELRGDPDRACDLKGGTRGGDIADRATDCAAAELDRTGLQDPLPGRNPVLFHRSFLLRKSKGGDNSFAQ